MALNRTQWSPIQESILLDLYSEFPQRWHRISAIMSKPVHSCIRKYKMLTGLLMKSQDRKWTTEEDEKLIAIIDKYSFEWHVISKYFSNCNAADCYLRYIHLSLGEESKDSKINQLNTERQIPNEKQKVYQSNIISVSRQNINKRRFNMSERKHKNLKFNDTKSIGLIEVQDSEESFIKIQKQPLESNETIKINQNKRWRWSYKDKTRLKQLWIKYGKTTENVNFIQKHIPHRTTGSIISMVKRLSFQDSDFKQIRQTEEKNRKWTDKDLILLRKKCQQFKELDWTQRWQRIAHQFPGRTPNSCAIQYRVKIMPNPTKYQSGQ